MLGTVLPSLLVYAVSYLPAREFKVTYTYDVGSDADIDRGLLGQSQDKNGPDASADKVERTVPSESGRKVLLDRFYSVENLDKLAAKLKQNGFDEFARGISQAKIELDVSDGSLTVTIIESPAEDVQKIAAIVRDNLEKVIPMYSVKEDLSRAIIRLKAEMADIEENRFALELELEHKKAILAELKTLASSDPGMVSGGPVLHFENVGENSEYLPLPYQVQAAEANIINIEQTIRSRQRKYNYYETLLSLNERLLDEARNRMSSYYTVDEFRSLLTRTEDALESTELRDYLSAYAKRLENTVSANTPIVETPGICPVPKGGPRKAWIVFVALLMMTTVGAFLLDAVLKSPKPGTVKSSRSDG